MAKDVQKSDEDNSKIRSKIFSVDVRKFILLTPEVDKESIFQLAKKLGFEINNPDGKDAVLFTLDAFDVPEEKVNNILDRINEVKDEIKKQQVNYYDENKDKISLDNKMLELVSTFLTNTKKYKHIDASKLQMVLSTVLGDLYQVEEENIRFLDQETIEHLAKAIVSNVLDETKLHLNQALVNTLIQIRKLAILWFFETISLNLYNLRTDRSETYKLQENREVELESKDLELAGKYEVIKVNIQSKEYRLAFSEEEYSLITFDIGKKNQDLIIPLLSAFFIDKATVRWRLNYSRIIIKAVSRLKDQVEHQIKNLSLEYHEISVEDLLSIEKELNESFEFLYQLLFNYKNQIESGNQSLKRYYQHTYSRKISSIVGGAISKAVRKVTPLEILDECDSLVDELANTTKQISDMKFQTLSIIKQLIKAKQEEDPTLFKKAMTKFQEIGENITAKTLSELIDKLFKN